MTEPDERNWLASLPETRAWRRGMPVLLDLCAERWRLTIGSPLSGGYMAQVYACTDADGNPCVLKLVPPLLSAEQEAAALRLWTGRRAVRLRAHNSDAGALLLDRILPGTPLPPGREDTSIAIAGEVLVDLHAAGAPPAPDFPPLAEAFEAWLERLTFEAEPGTAGLDLLDAASRAATRLCATTGEVVVLHGDYTDKNLLLGPSGYIAIDPMPSVGDPCADIGMFASEHPPARHTAERARALAVRLDRDPDRAAQWAAVWAVGGACETWREDSDELQSWVRAEAPTLLSQP